MLLYGWKSPLIITIFGARRCNELIFCTDLHEAVLYRIEEVLAAANCAGPWNHSLSGGALKSKQQLSGNLFILFCKLFILKLWLRSFEETVRGKFESFSTSAVSYDGVSAQGNYDFSASFLESNYIDEEKPELCSILICGKMHDHFLYYLYSLTVVP